MRRTRSETLPSWGKSSSSGESLVDGTEKTNRLRPQEKEKRMADLSFGIRKSLSDYGKGFLLPRAAVQ